MAKKIKHITININEDQYNALKLIADKENRNITNMAYILLNSVIEAAVINYIDISSSGFNKAKLY